MKIGREGNAYEKLKSQSKIKNEGISYNISYKTVLGGFDEIVADLSKEIDIEAVEPTLVFSPNEENPFSVKALYKYSPLSAGSITIIFLVSS